MDVRELLRKQGISSFTAADFEFVTSKIAADPSRLILVGGQSVAVWGIIFDVASPLGAHQTLTKDADWLGGKLDAKWLCDQLGPSSDVDLQFAADFDVTPSSALAFLRRDNRVLMMDFLRSIVGPENAEIQELAVSVVLQDSSMLVMHPLLCLESRFANLKELPAKRQGNGPLQASKDRDDAADLPEANVAPEPWLGNRSPACADVAAARAIARNAIFMERPPCCGEAMLSVARHRARESLSLLALTFIT